MLVLYGCTVMVFSSPYIEEVLPAQLRGGRSLLLGKTRKRVQGADSLWPRCGEEDDLKQVLRACPELENPRKRNFMQVLPPLLTIARDQVETARFFREVFDWDLPRPTLP
jgi:hypothetical protein